MVEPGPHAELSTFQPASMSTSSSSSSRLSRLLKIQLVRRAHRQHAGLHHRDTHPAAHEQSRVASSPAYPALPSLQDKGQPVQRSTVTSEPRVKPRSLEAGALIRKSFLAPAADASSLSGTQQPGSTSLPDQAPQATSTSVNQAAKTAEQCLVPARAPSPATGPKPASAPPTYIRGLPSGLWRTAITSGHVTRDRSDVHTSDTAFVRDAPSSEHPAAQQQAAKWKGHEQRALLRRPQRRAGALTK